MVKSKENIHTGVTNTKILTEQNHSITIIDQSSEDIKKINDTQDVKGIVGRATLPSVLENAGAEKADNELDVVFAVNMKPDFSDTVACDTPGEAGIDVDVEITFMVGLLDDSTVGVLMPPSAYVGAPTPNELVGTSLPP